MEVPGIEPGSFGAGAELLRVQPVTGFSAPTSTQASRRWAQSLLGFPRSTVTVEQGGAS